MKYGQASGEYALDAFQRMILFTDIFRKRGNNYLAHIKAGQPPVLVFDYETVIDGRNLERPVNYALVKIVDRRKKEGNEPGANMETERRSLKPEFVRKYAKRPIVVIDPRAGHGPGIGGSKLNSQIGVALDNGHPVYFILFFTEPEKGQTLYDVQQAEVKFLEEVGRRHPDADKPAVIGNCQAGWAAALIGADRPDVVGPMVFNGSPLSYWGGVEGANPMRYTGGLLGGIWLTSLSCDLGNGKFDGVHLVSNFENLNPANTLWTKQYHLWANVDTEEERFLEFEKWWGGFFKLNREEIHFIVDGLFVGNELEQGSLELKKGKTIRLKNFKDPIVVFASKGDNITPPQQALNWIVKVYGTVDEIKRNGQVIVYMLHEKIGHLGIFVSGSVADKEHKEIISNVGMIEYLSPGLYEMVIHEEPSKPWLNDHKVEFMERDMSDILKLDDGLEEEEAFAPVSALSRFNDKVYNTFLGPAVRSAVTEPAAEWMRQMHPLRMQRYMFSDYNPFIFPFKYAAPVVKQYRKQVSEDNMFLQMEKIMSDTIVSCLNSYRDMRDTTHEFAFRLMYDNPWMKTLFKAPASEADKDDDNSSMEDAFTEKEYWKAAMEQGGFAEAIVRIIIAVMGSNKTWTKEQFRVANTLIGINDRMKTVTPADMKRIVKRESAFLSKNEDMAIEALPKLIPDKNGRIEAFEIANSVATGNMVLDEFETAMLEKIRKALDL